MISINISKIFRKKQNQKEKKDVQVTLNKDVQLPNFNDLNEIYSFIYKQLSSTDDLSKKTFTINEQNALVVYLESLTDDDRMYRELFETSLLNTNQSEKKETVTIYNKIEDISEGIKSLLEGNCLLFEEGNTTFFEINVTKSYERGIDEPANEKVVRGDHEGFIENIKANINLIRKRLKNNHMVVKYYSLGDESETKIAIMYHKNIANPKLIMEVERRIKAVSADLVINPGYLEEFIEDSPHSIFPQMLNTERVDRAVANIMEGRIAILSHGAPCALILPVNLFLFFQSPDDYNSRWLMGSFFRLLRVFSVIIAISLPAFYIAVISFHFEIIPGTLILTIKESVEQIPFPPIVEAFLIEITLELIREAGIRLPSPIGQTIGIVGGLVIGDAIVQAGLVSNIMIIVVALTAISSFVIPSHEMSNAIRIIRFPTMIMASLLGFYGIVLFLVFVIIHLIKLTSFGTPYFSPVSPLRIKDLKDSILRLPIWLFRSRPSDVGAIKIKRAGNSRKWEENE